MKLRIKGDSLRLRVARSELARLMSDGRVDETVHFGPGKDAVLTYGLAHGDLPRNISVEYSDRRVTILLSSQAASRWAQGDDAGIYGEAELTNGNLTLAVEKDFACLDGNELDNEDTFPNPTVGVAC